LTGQQFETSNIASQNAKYSHLVQYLTAETANEVSDILMAPPSEHRYDDLKRAIIKRTQPSMVERISNLLSQEPSGDQKPSQLLRRMQQLPIHHNDIPKTAVITPFGLFEFL